MINHQLLLTFDHRLGELLVRRALDEVAERPDGAEHVQRQFREDEQDSGNETCNSQSIQWYFCYLL